MSEWYTCEKCGEVIEIDKKKAHKIFCYAWVADGDKQN
tara:strand:+ start:173 stop:286 length:114 start_codon:yes stop_codon:yes gene_type:complete